MSRSFGIWLGLWLAGTTAIGLAAQPASAPPVTAAAGMAPASAPRRPTPIDEFRALLKADAGVRRQVLATKTEAQRAILSAKFEEYLALPESEQELRLRVLQLKWHLQPLLELPRAERPARLAAIPADYRALVEARLQEWDLLPPDLQQEVLENENIRRYFIRLEASSPTEQASILNALSPERRRQLEAGLAQWRQMTASQRQQVCLRFDRFFELRDEDRQKALEALPSPERQQVEPVLENLEQLPREQRRQYLSAFHRLASMPAAERERFLWTAERWKKIPEAEKRTWRELDGKLPPLPPGFPLEPLPPLPPGLTKGD